MILFRRMARYWRVGFYLHLVTALVMGLTLWGVSWLPDGVFSFCVGLDMAFFCSGLGAAVCAQLDAGSRFQEYKRVKDLLFENGFDERIIRLFVHSRCQREAVITAARDLGLEAETMDYFEQAGYRWFHFLPAAIRSRPLVLLQWRFWSRTLFVKPYVSRYFDC